MEEIIEALSKLTDEQLLVILSILENEVDVTLDC